MPLGLLTGSENGNVKGAYFPGDAASAAGSNAEVVQFAVRHAAKLGRPQLLNERAA